MSAIAAINIGLKQLGIEGEDKRDFYERLTGELGLRDMTPKQHEIVLAELRRLGFRHKPRAGKKYPAAAKGYIRLIHALWRSCAQKGVVEDGRRTALRIFVEKRTGVSDPDFLTFEQASPIIDALKAMEARGHA